MNYGHFISPTFQKLQPTLIEIITRSEPRVRPINKLVHPKKNLIDSKNTPLATLPILLQIVLFTDKEIVITNHPPLSSKNISLPTKTLTVAITKHVKKYPLRISRGRKRRNFKYPVVQYIIKK